MPQPQHSTAAPPVGPAHPLLTKTVHSDSLVKLPDGLNLWYQLRLAWALVSAPQGLVLQENLLQGTGQVPVVDFVETLVIRLKGSAVEACETRKVTCWEHTELMCTYSRSEYRFLVKPACCILLGWSWTKAYTHNPLTNLDPAPTNPVGLCNCIPGTIRLCIHFSFIRHPLSSSKTNPVQAVAHLVDVSVANGGVGGVAQAEKTTKNHLHKGWPQA